MFYVENYDSNLVIPHRNSQERLNRTFVLKFYPNKITTDLLYTKHLYFVDSYRNNYHNKSEYLDKISSYIEERTKNQLSSGLVFEYSYEYLIDIPWFIDYLSLLKEKNIDNVRFIFNIACKSILESLLPKEYTLKIHYIDYFAMSELRNVEYKINTPSSLPLSDRNINLNILVGRIFEKNTRLNGLYLLWKKGLAQKGITGILITKEMLVQNADIVIDKEFYYWLENNIGPVDNIQMRVVESNNRKIIRSNGSPYSTDNYNKSRVSYVFESYWLERTYPPEFLTEKIYRPIMNKSPFVLQGNPDSLIYLKKLGFNVYDDFLSKKYYEDNKDYNMYIEKTVDAAEELLEATTKYTTEIEKITEQNYNRFMQLATDEFSSLEQFLGHYV